MTESGGASDLWPTVHKETNRGHWKIEEKAANSTRWLTEVRATKGGSRLSKMGSDGGGARVAWCGVSAKVVVALELRIGRHGRERLLFKALETWEAQQGYA